MKTFFTHRSFALTIRHTATLLLLIVAATSARAATYVWTGTGLFGDQDFQFSNPYNWAGLAAPSAGETGITLVFSNGYPKTVTNDISGLAVAVIQFQGSNYVVHGKPSGNALTLRSTALGGYGITANGNSCQFASTCPLVVSNSGLITVSGVNTLKISAKISGPSGISKNGPGTLLFNATQANTYAGTTAVTDGELDLDNGIIGIPSFTPFVSVPGTLNIGSSNLNFTPVVRLLADDQIADTSAVTVHEDGKLWLNTHDDTLGSLTLQGGLVNTGLGANSTSPGTLSLNGNLTNLLSGLNGYNGSISGKLNLGLLTRTFSVAAGSQLAMDANISGGSVAPFTAGFTLVDGGTLLLFNATNTYNGPTTVDNGTLYLSGSTPLLGSTNSGTIVNSNGVLFLSGVTNTYEPLALNGGTNPVVGWEQWNEWRGPVTLTGDCRFDITTTNILDQLTFFGVVIGSGKLHKTGSGGVVRLAGGTANTFTGGIVADAGFVFLEKSNNIPALNGPIVIGLEGETNTSAWVSTGNEQIPDNLPIKVQFSGTFSVSMDCVETVGNLELSGGDVFVFGQGISSGPAMLVIAGNVTNRVSVPFLSEAYASTFYGPIYLSSGNHIFDCKQGYLDVRSQLSGPGAITKIGVGDLVFLNSTNNYTGLTTVLDGALYLDNNAVPGAIDSGTVVGGNGLLIFNSTSVTNEALTMQAGGGILWHNNLNRWKGPVTLETNTVFSGFSGGQLLLDGVVSGAGGITISEFNQSTLALVGSADNTFAGSTIVKNGTLVLGKIGAYAIPGDLAVGDTNNLANTSVLLLNKPNQFTPAAGNQLVTRTVTLNPNAMVNFNFDQQMANLVMVDADLDTGAVTLSLNRNLTVQHLVDSLHSSLYGKLALANAGGGTNHIISVPDVSGSLIIQSIISESAGSAQFQKTGPGYVGLMGNNNTFSGNCIVSEGYLSAQGITPLGTLTAGTFVESGATLVFQGGTNTEPLTFASGSGLEILNTNLQTGAFSLSGNATIYVVTNSTLTIDPAISGVGGLTKDGPGRLRLAGSLPNTYAGTTHLAGGFLELAKTSSNAIPQALIVGEPAGFVQWLGSNQMADGGALIITNSGGAYLNGFIDTIGSLAGNQFLFLNTGALTVGANNSSTTYSGLLSGTGGSLTKIGTGKLTLTANNAYTGNTTVNGGTLLVQGLQPSSPVFVNSGTLGGTGTVGNVTVASAGHLSPGSSPGKFSTGIFNFIGNTATLDVEINGPVPGTNYDQVKVTGGVSFMGGTLNLAMNTGGAISNQYVIIDNDGADIVGGNFTGLPEGTMVTNNGVAFQITYHGGDGNDVALIQKTLGTPPVINSVKLVGPALQINGSGQPNTTYTVEATTTLTPPIPWSVIGTVPVDGAGLMQFVDSDINQYPARFYRLRLP